MKMANFGIMLACIGMSFWSCLKEPAAAAYWIGLAVISRINMEAK